jgi:hypothetical protein
MGMVSFRCRSFLCQFQLVSKPAAFGKGQRGYPSAQTLGRDWLQSPAMKIFLPLSATADPRGRVHLHHLGWNQTRSSSNQPEPAPRKSSTSTQSKI